MSDWSDYVDEFANAIGEKPPLRDVARDKATKAYALCCQIDIECLRTITLNQLKFLRPYHTDARKIEFLDLCAQRYATVQDKDNFAAWWVGFCDAAETRTQKKAIYAILEKAAKECKKHAHDRTIPAKDVTFFN